ncbi:S1C family serine protease [Micromonospora siamensis]|uniref:Trypsin-like peptidase domain-containing protein n=1 Tax=Micromonospora siamensis TaxID=299152 RepID=A0A1C5HT10_9ACTN|nr:trypsin-like peptidase domain-containing protein [Micromonospora siamensis]SCG49154.1 Trypsin-like peptidase domain-containing protein [Micromonospora siamensis]
MTAWYGPGGAPPGSDAERRPELAGDGPPGPRAPRTERPWPPTNAYPTPPPAPPVGPAYPPAPSYPPAAAGPSGGTAWPTAGEQHRGFAGQRGTAPPAGTAVAPPASRDGWSPPPVTAPWGGVPATGGAVPPVPPGPVSAAPFGPGPVASGHGGGLPGTGADAPSRRRWTAPVAIAVAVVLAVVTGVQAYQIGRLSDTGRRLEAGQDDHEARLDDLTQRTDALERQADAAFNPEAIAKTVLPSVFRVRAGQFTGTAFVVGKPAAGGGANLFTNFHVVESVWSDGGRKVFLERTGQRFPATIVKVDKEHDVAHLRTTAKFTGLTTAPSPVRSGQQIIVVGAPLGLEDSVTTGVVSAFRKDESGSGQVIQFDAPINPGNSGGPVINGAKQVVGIATAKARNAEGIGLAVPIRTACAGFRIC